MNGCANEELLALHAGNDLEGAAAAELRRHLLDCPRCRRLLAEFRSSQAWLLSHREAPVDAALLGELQRRLDERLGSRRPPSVLVAWLGRLWESTRALGQPLLVVAASASLIVIGVSGLGGSDGVPSARPGVGPGAGIIAGARPGAMVAAAVPGGVPLDPAAEVLPEPDEAARLRIELSTRDPDVRIIWFASNDAPGGR
jgi:hypothetical protein